MEREVEAWFKDRVTDMRTEKIVYKRNGEIKFLANKENQ
jgi:hypothetical protein